MAIEPVNLGRVSFNLRAFSLLASMTQTNRDLFRTQEQLSSGLRLLAPSDDPPDGTAASLLSQKLERQQQLLDNIGFADNFVSSTDTAMSEISTLLTEAKGLALANIDSVVSQAERDSAAVAIDGIIRQLVTVGNRQYLDVEMFAGRQVETMPFSQVYGGIMYAGDTGNLNVRIDALQEVAFNLTGDDLYGALSSEVAGTADLSPGLTANTRLADMNGALGLGIRPGVVRITESAGPNTWDVDLSDAHTVQDVIDMVSAATGGVVTLAINGSALDVNGPGNLTITDLNNGTMAGDLGIEQTVAGPAYTGQDTDPRLTLTTTIASLNDGAGLVLGTLQITNGTLSATVDLSGATTIEDVLNALNGADVAICARINDAADGIDVVNRLSGSELRIGEDGGNTATLLGIRSLDADTPLSALNGGRGVDIVEGKPDLRIVHSNGTEYLLNLDGAQTLQDVIDAINAVTGADITASLAATGNGIRLVEAVPGGGQLQVTRPDLDDSPSFAADDLGFGDQVTVVGPGEIVSADVNGIQPQGVFTVLLQLREALRAGDTAGISDAANALEAALEQVNSSRGVVGSTSQGLQRQLDHTEEQLLETQARLSELVDLDYAEAITQFTQIQTAYQAALTTGSRLLSLSFLDFLR
jgi:flagellar hook-associated protein 3 FlgL